MGGGYTLSTTILHYNFWKRRGSFLGLSECRGFLEVLYDSENRKTYEGFRIGEVSVCYGRSYYSDIQKVEYEGMICEGKRWGKGVHYDRNGDIVFEGEWMNDSYQIGRRIEKRNSYPLLHCLIEEFIVSNGCCNGPIWEGIDFSFITHLRQFYVGDYLSLIHI